MWVTWTMLIFGKIAQGGLKFCVIIIVLPHVIAATILPVHHRHWKNTIDTTHRA
jgi:hypothetical protein